MVYQFQFAERDIYLADINNSSKFENTKYPKTNILWYIHANNYYTYRDLICEQSSHIKY